jgi:transposase
MRKSIIFVGVDVDDQNFHIGAIDEGGEIRELCSKPQLNSLVKQLKKLETKTTDLKICYEAGYLGYSLCRDLRKLGFDCEVIAPTHIPREASGKSKKTDRIDANKLARFYQQGLLTAVTVPTDQQECDRDLIRTRRFVSDQCKQTQRYILSMCRRMGWNYRQESDRKAANHWTFEHRRWLEAKLRSHAPHPSLNFGLSNMLIYLKQLENQIEHFDKEIERLSQSETYQKPVSALGCYRGIGVLHAMTICTELQDIKRFDHPRRLTSYVGLDIREFSSGGKENKLGITKMGNKYVRTAVVEACQLAFTKPKVGPPLKKRRVGADPKYIEIADRCMQRLYRKSNHLLHRGKSRNPVKVACAREMLGFIWESLRIAA